MKLIPFEIHLTTANLPRDRQTEFVRFCSENDAKALTIELARGEFLKQPMLTKVIFAKNLNSILLAATELSKLLTEQDFAILRLKVEIPSFCSEKFSDFNSTFEPYFEWHGKIDYNRVNELQTLCENHQVHLSRNALTGEARTRFITLREFGDKSTFQSRIDALIADLGRDGWNLGKQRSEYCIYDNNKFLDAGWLSA